MSFFLQDRFINSLQLFQKFLMITGVRLTPFDSLSCWKKLIYRLWSVFFLIFCVQSNSFIVIKRSCLLNRFISCPQWFDNFIGDLTNVLIRTSQLVSDTIIHITIILTLQPTITTFLKNLEFIDGLLKRPRLTRLKRLSLVGLIYLVVTVSQN